MILPVFPILKRGMKRILIYREKDYKITCMDLKDIYEENGIKIDINSACNEGIYSCICRVSETELYANGKGILPIQACTSSLAEMMERLQNLTELSLKTKHIFNTDMKYWDTIMSFDELVNGSYSILRRIFPNARELDKVLGLLMQVYSDSIPCNYYKTSCDGKIYGIPILICAVLYGTNGMSAGNSIDESIEYAKYEISERMVNKAVYYNQYDNYILLNPSVLDISKEVLDVLNKIPYRVILFKPQELSMNAVGMLILEQNSKRHFIKFGAHSDLSIAIERCVTELFQGRSIDELDKYMSLPKEESYNLQDFHVIFRSGEGGYPENTIEKILKGKYNNLNFDTNISEIQLFDSLLYRETSFLGFPTVHCILPTISEVNLPTYEVIKRTIDEGLIFNGLIQLPNLNIQEKYNLLETLIDYIIDWKQPIKALLDLPLHNIDVLDYPIGFLMIGLGFQIGSRELFSTMLDKFDIVDICNCVNRAVFLDFSQEYFDDASSMENIKEYSYKMQSQEDFKVAHNIYIQSIDIVSRFIKMTCFRCYECEIQSNCKYSYTIDFYKKILAMKVKNDEIQNQYIV